VIGKKRARFIAVVIALAVVALCVSLWVNEGPLWRLVFMKKVQYESSASGHLLRGWKIEYRIGGLSIFPQEAQNWYVETGYKGHHWLKVDRTYRVTYWNLDGTVAKQELLATSPETKTTPPWWWGVQDQTKPTAPWWDHEKNAPKDD